MAQNVTIGGTLEIAPISNGKSTVGTETTKSSRTSGPNTWSTSVVSISGTEDLGGGLRASFTLISGAGATTTSGDSAADTGIGNRERAIGLSGNFGALRFGRFVPAAASGFQALSGAGSATLAGSIYGVIGGGTSAAPNAIHGNTAAATNMERINNVLQYTSPNMSGFTLNVNVANNSNDSDASNKVGKASTSQNGLHLGYSSGPLSVGVATNRATVKSEEANAAAAAAAEMKSTVNWVGASYDLGVARLFAAHVTRDTKVGGAAAVDLKVTNVGVSVPMGAITLRASTYTGKDKRSTAANDNMKLSGHQVSATYALSKRTSIIAAVGENEIKRDSGNTNQGTLRKVQASTLTINHTF